MPGQFTKLNFRWLLFQRCPRGKRHGYGEVQGIWLCLLFQQMGEHNQKCMHSAVEWDRNTQVVLIFLSPVYLVHWELAPSLESSSFIVCLFSHLAPDTGKILILCFKQCKIKMLTTKKNSPKCFVKVLSMICNCSVIPKTVRDIYCCLTPV